MNWQETVQHLQHLDITAGQKWAAECLELQTHQPPYWVFKVKTEDLCVISPKFLTDLTMALRKHVGGLVHVMVGHDDQPGRVVH